MRAPDDAGVARMTGWPVPGARPPAPSPPPAAPSLPSPRPDPAPSALLAARYARALDIAAVVAVAGWHLAGAAPLLVAHLGSYASDQFQIA